MQFITEHVTLISNMSQSSLVQVLNQAVSSTNFYHETLTNIKRWRRVPSTVYSYIMMSCKRETKHRSTPSRIFLATYTSRKCQPCTMYLAVYIVPGCIHCTCTTGTSRTFPRQHSMVFTQACNGMGNTLASSLARSGSSTTAVFPDKMNECQA